MTQYLMSVLDDGTGPETEKEDAAIDVFMCGRRCSPQKALDSLRLDLQPVREKVRRILRRMPKAAP